MTIKQVKCGGQVLPVREFNLNDMCENPSIVMLAKRASGKSWVVRDILRKFANLPGGVIISKTERMSCFYGKFFPESYIHYEYSSELVDDILKRQQMIIKKAREKIKKGKKVDPRAFLIMDDCLADKGSWATDKPIMEIFFNGRHYYLMYILTMQFPLGIKPELRANFDYIFLLAEDTITNLKRIYDHYAGVFPNFNLFKMVFSQLTDDHGCMVIVNRGVRKDFLDKVFWFKAKNVSVDRIGCSQFNKLHDKNFDKDWSNNTRHIDINKFNKKI